MRQPLLRRLATHIGAGGFIFAAWILFLATLLAGGGK